jgi:hypothetical protein
MSISHETYHQPRWEFGRYRWPFHPHLPITLLERKTMSDFFYSGLERHAFYYQNDPEYRRVQDQEEKKPKEPRLLEGETTLRMQKHDDPGHGWLQVPIRLLVDLHLVDRISTCSYMYDKIAYLEEDKDAGTFLHAMKLKYPEIEIDIRTIHSNDESIIRTFLPFNNLLIDEDECCVI